MTHIQKIAPGPPRVMAVATPAMLPIPIVAAMEVIRAPKWETSPALLPSSLRLISASHRA